MLAGLGREDAVMATGYTISIGYNNGSAFGGDCDEAWRELKQAAAALANDPMAIAQEAVAFGAPTVDDEATIIGYAERFKSTDATLTIDGNQQHIFLMSSGANVMKGHVRRAFCRLLIGRMHRKGIEVNLIVA